MQQWLTSLQTAYFQLTMGQSVVSAGYDGKSVTYKQADGPAMIQLIGLLQRALGVNGGRRALRPYFR